MPQVAEITKNTELCQLLTLADNDAPLNRGMSMVARNRVLVGLCHPRGLESLTYDETDCVDNVRDALRAVAEWLLKVADEAQ